MWSIEPYSPPKDSKPRPESFPSSFSVAFWLEAGSVSRPSRISGATNISTLSSIPRLSSICRLNRILPITSRNGGRILGVLLLLQKGWETLSTPPVRALFFDLIPIVPLSILTNAGIYWVAKVAFVLM